jgi:predicted DsbA family dithiol-disulfide isomerase
MQKRLKKVADSLSLPLADRTMTYNSRAAQELAKWAESEGKGEEFHHAVFRAYFAEAKNIALAGVLIHLAESIGLPAGEAERVILSRRFRKAVDADWARSQVLGIDAVPTFIFGSRRLVGFQPYEALAELIGRL